MGDRPDCNGGTELRLAILGPVAGSRGGAAVALGPTRLRAVLTLLVLYADAGLSRADIVGALWAGDPPATAATMVHGYITRIRVLLGHGRVCAATPRPKQALSWDGARYRLAPGAVESDLTEFARLADLAGQAAASGDAARACQRYEESVRLWRAEPVADIEILQGHPAVIELGQRRTSLIVDYAATAEAADLHEQVLGHLQALAGRAPLDERVHARLMIALAATGQQAAALGIYQNMRRRLDDELGILPGRELAEAHLRVLHQQAAPAPAPRPAPTRPPVPRQLPVAPRHFAGRAREMQALSRLLGPPGGDPPGVVVIAAIGGTAGIGKTALAVHWAHQIADRFPDGQLYINLRGFDPSGKPVNRGDAIRRLLDALQVPAHQVPSDADAQQDLYRSEIARRRMLIVLDNAANVDQVRPLLPGAPGCLILVTSRHQLAGLVAVEGAYPVTLDLLSPAEASELLAQRLGPERLAAEPGVATELTGLCARLPLALSIVAARAAMEPGLPMSALAGQLRSASGRLDALDAGDVSSARAVFSWSYQGLGEPAARMFRLLSLHPGPDITAAAAASLADVQPSQAREVLGELTHASLVAEHVPGRFACHDLLRAYAVERAAAEEYEPARRAAIQRMLDHYVLTANAAVVLLDPHLDRITLAPSESAVRPEELAGYEQAMAWFEAEHHVLLAVLGQAVSAGFDTHAWQIPLTMATFLDRRGYPHDYAATQRIALAAACRLADRAAQAQAHRNLGNVSVRLGAHQEARSQYGQALELYRQLGDQAGEGRAHICLGLICMEQDQYRESLSHSERALALYRSAGLGTGQARALNNIGWCYTQLGDCEQGIARCEQALTLAQEAGDQHGQAITWDSLGYAHHHLGHYSEAIACYQRSLSILEAEGDRFRQTSILTHIGDTHHADGRWQAARQAWRQALGILDDLHHPDAGRVRAKLEAEAQPAKVAQSR
jgi:DNA-binding SARP family transcriptional activator/tetratricopeptide (TPR) repeat protein